MWIAEGKGGMLFREEGREGSLSYARASSPENWSDWDNAVGTSGTTVRESGVTHPSYSDMVKGESKRKVWIGRGDTGSLLIEIPGVGTEMNKKVKARWPLRWTPLI